MKLKMTLVLLSTLFTLASIKAQNISLSLRDASLQTVFKEINRQTNFSFFCKDETLNRAGKVTIEVSNASLDDVMKRCLNGKNLNYSIEGKKIVIKQKDNPPKSNANEYESAQDRIIKGRVTNETGEAVPGVSVTVKGTIRGTATNADGFYQLSVTSTDKVLVFSGASMKTKEVVISGEPVMNVTLTPKVTGMGDVVVTGIVNRNKNSFTGAVTVLSKEDLFKVNNKNLMQSLKVLEPSLMIFDNLTMGSDPNQMPDMNLRGTSSFPQQQDVDLKGGYVNNPNQPLFILDGFEASLTKVVDLDMNRIESVTILKDASAKALYGSKAANGVVVIETKKLTGGQAKISYSGSLDWEMPDLSSYNLMNSAEKLQAEKIYGMYSQNPTVVPNFQTQLTLDQQYNSHLSAVLAGVNTDWSSLPLRNGLGQKHALSVELGEKNLNVIADFSYNNIQGVMKGSSRNTFATSIALSYRYKKLLFRDILSVTSNKGTNSPYGSFGDYSKMNPYWTPYDQFGIIKKNAETGIIPYTGYIGIGNLYAPNPLYNSTLNIKLTNDYIDVTDNFYTEMTILPGLKTTLRAGVTATKNQADEFYPANYSKFDNYTGADFFRKGSYKRNEGDQVRFSGDLNINYSKVFRDKHFFFANLGGNMSQNSFEEVVYQAEGFPNDRMTDILFANQYAKYNSRPTGTEGTSRDVGVLSVVNYSYDNRFFADATYRASASSQFGANNRWGNFWSAGVGWNIQNETWVQNLNLFDRLKLRGSVGSTGSQNFSSYQSIATYKYVLDKVYQNYLGAYLMGLANPDLKWQQKMDYNVGLDFTIKKKLVGRIDVYQSNTENTLIDYSVAPSTGFASVKENLGKIRNVGIEGMLTYTVYANPKTRSFFSVTASAIHNENKIVSISDALRAYNEAQDKIADDKFNNKAVVKYYEGMSMNSIWAVRSMGIDPANGQEIYLDKSGNKTYTYSAANQVVVGDNMPKLTGTLGFNGEYKGLGLNVFFRYLYGAQLYNQTLVDRVENVDMSFNVDKRVLNSTWQKPGDVKPYKSLAAVSVQNPDGTYTVKYTRTQPSDRFVQNRNEFSLASVNLSYDFYRWKFVKSIGMERLRCGFYMNDVFMLSSIRVERGLNYPFSRKFSFSLQTTF
ncbi:SusC/RagA family TonB-linked outer membrane protein [Parasegetibacter sp. MAH-26]|uniref:SusC/RagA family TonB-linked outer membrane protein n=2 Tax=Pinibacter aurantiacus TaxID=2851599 RepID=A0A9E2SB72_9BACT|nr:SusC/RagA family TonB-linked outer membrane protein [Pinibacter aurantiacus]